MPAARTAIEDVDEVKGFLAPVRDSLDAVKEQANAVSAAKREAAGEGVAWRHNLTGRLVFSAWSAFREGGEKRDALP